MFDFRDIIEQYFLDIIIIRHSEGYYDHEHGGVWVPGQEQRIQIRGAVLSFSGRDLKEQLQYGEGGAYTRQDRKVYTYEKLAQGEMIEHKGNRYTVAEEADYSDLANGLYIYFVRRVT